MTAATELDSTTCPQCEQHVAEIERLRAELSKLQGQQVPPAVIKWWGLAASGVFLLAVAPCVPLLISASLDDVSGLPDSIAHVIWGVSIGLPWAQWSFVGILCMLHQGPLWQRVLMHIGLSLGNGLTLLVAVTVLEAKPEELLAVGWLAPVLAVAIMIPTFVARVLRRWTLAHQGTKTVARPVSLVSYLALMAILGIVVTIAKFISWDWFAADAKMATIFLVVFGGPLVAMSFLHLWLLPKILQTRERYSVPTLQWLLLLLVFTVPTVVSLVGFRLVETRPTANAMELLWIAGLILSIPCAGGMLSTAGYFWLRMLGYRLLSSGRPARPTPDYSPTL